jgi:hypothetical protein
VAWAGRYGQGPPYEAGRLMPRWFYTLIMLVSATTAIVTGSVYSGLFAFIAWQAADVAGLRSEVRHVQNRIDAINGGFDGDTS